MSSTPKNRLKTKTKSQIDSNVESVSHSPSETLKFLMEPPRDFLPSREDVVRLIAVIAIASLVAVSCNFFSNLVNRIPKPFCDTAVDSSDSFSGPCEPCPIHGECYQGKFECLRGYRKHGRLCVEDGEINRAAKKLSELVESHLCKANAQFLCDDVGTVWVPEEDIWTDLDGQDLMDNVGADNNTFIYAKIGAMKSINQMFETRSNSHGVNELKCPDSLSGHYKPVTCRIRQWISRHALVILPVCLLLVGCTFLLWKVRRKLYLSNRAEQLYNQVCEILEENALRSKRVNGECEPWLVVSMLRDHLLLPRERKDHVLWKKVEQLVQEDSRVDRYPKVVKGEARVVWEWQVEGSLSSSRMRNEGQSSKLKSKGGAYTMHSYQDHYKMKAEPKPLIS